MHITRLALTPFVLFALSCGGYEGDAENQSLPVDSQNQSLMEADQTVVEEVGHQTDEVLPAYNPGYCGCKNSGFANVCTTDYDNCSPGFRPQCGSTRFNCVSSGCTCVDPNPDPDPPPGYCGCKNSGFANVCTTDYNNCNPGFRPQCGSTRFNCESSGCTCV